MSKSQKVDAQRNWLIGAMETSSRKRIAPHLEPVQLKLGAIVCEAGGLLKDAYFPQGGVLSLLTVLENGSAIETANIGREGAFGLFAAMYSRVSFNRCLVQLESGIVRCPIELLQSEFKRSEHVRDLFVSYCCPLGPHLTDGALEKAAGVDAGSIKSLIAELIVNCFPSLRSRACRAKPCSIRKYGPRFFRCIR
jgi:hypothetical protein